MREHRLHGSRTKTVLPLALVGFHGGPSAYGEVRYVGSEAGRAKARDAFTWIVTILKKQAGSFTACISTNA